MPAITTPAGITLEYETLGSPSDPAMLLVMGFGAQLIAWPRAFAERLAQAGRHVVLFDNRDCGLSSKLDGDPPDIPAILAAASTGDIDKAKALAPYTLSDMARDGFALLSALDIEQAHLVGASMGGMIAQAFVIAYPEKTRTFTSIMSTTGDPTVGQASPDALGSFLGPAPTTRDEAIERGVQLQKVIGSPGYPFDEPHVRERAAAAYDRSFHPAGMIRQVAAVVTQPDRTQALHGVRVPTLVIHGADDPLVDSSGGRATADAVPGATLKIVPGMGHDLPPALNEEVIDSLVENFSRA